MATVTPNFNWPVPTSTDLVKDGATAIEALGDSIDASLVDLKGGTTGQVLKKATNTDMDFVWSADSAGMTNPMTTTGDTIYSSSGSTPARLGIGSTGQVLTVASGVPSWATPAGASSAMTLVSRVSFSNVADTGTTFDGVFSSTYKSYQIVIETLYAATPADDLLWQWRYAGPTTQSANNYSNCINTNAAVSTVTNSGVNGGTANTLTTRIGGIADPGGGIIFATGVSGVSTTPVISGMYYECSNATSANFSAMTVTARIYTGFILSSSTSNITGTVAVYGLA
jgi:hypothetical protein